MIFAVECTHCQCSTPRPSPRFNHNCSNFCILTNLNENISKTVTYSDTLVLNSHMSIVIFKFHLEQLWRSTSWFSKITLKPRDLAKKNNYTFLDIDILYRTRLLQTFYPWPRPRFENICSSVVRSQPIGNAKKAVRVSVNMQRLICMDIHCHPMKLLRMLYLFIVVVPFHG